MGIVVSFDDDFAQAMAKAIAPQVREMVELEIDKIKEKNKWLSPAQVAEYTGMGVTWVYDQIQKQKLPHVKSGGTGGKVLINKKELDKYLKSLEIPAEDLTVLSKPSKFGG